MCCCCATAASSPDWPARGSNRRAAACCRSESPAHTRTAPAPDWPRAARRLGRGAGGSQEPGAVGAGTRARTLPRQPPSAAHRCIRCPGACRALAPPRRSRFAPPRAPLAAPSTGIHSPAPPTPPGRHCFSSTHPLARPPALAGLGRRQLQGRLLIQTQGGAGAAGGAAAAGILRQRQPPCKMHAGSWQGQAQGGPGRGWAGMRRSSSRPPDVSDARPAAAQALHLIWRRSPSSSEKHSGQPHPSSLGLQQQQQQTHASPNSQHPHQLPPSRSLLPGGARHTCCCPC